MKFKKYTASRGYGYCLVVTNAEGLSLTFCEPTGSDYQRDVFPPENWEEINDKEFERFFKINVEDLEREEKNAMEMKLIHFHYKEENHDCKWKEWVAAHGNLCPCCYGSGGNYDRCQKGKDLSNCKGCEDYLPIPYQRWDETQEEWVAIEL